MADNIINEYKAIIPNGESFSLKALGLKDEDLEKCTLSSSENEHVSVNKKGIITAKKSGEATISLYLKGQSNRYALIKVKVIESDEYLSPNLSFFNNIDPNTRNKFISNNLCSLNEIINKFSTSGDRTIYAKKLGISEYEAELYFRQATLYCIPNMTKEFALFAALVGIRNPDDLSKVSAIKLENAFELLKNNVLLSHPDFTFPTYTEISKIIQSAKNMDQDSCACYSQTGGLESMLSSLSSNESQLTTDSEVLNEGLKFLENIKPSLPLPRTISGRIKVKKDNKTQNSEALPQSGLLVSISGISNPAQDKTEDENDYSCYTNPNGEFSITMPDKYNMQETITLSISEKKDMTYAIAGQNSSHKVEFVKRASEILENEYISINKKKKKASQILSIIKNIRDDNNHAMEIEKKLRKMAYTKYAETQKLKEKKAIEEEIDLQRINITNEVEYHIFNQQKNINKLKLKYNDELSRNIEAITQTFDEEKNVIACIALLLQLSSSTQQKEQESSKQIATRSIKTSEETTANQQFKKLYAHAVKFDTSILEASRKNAVEKTKTLIQQLNKRERINTLSISAEKNNNLKIEVVENNTTANTAENTSSQDNKAFEVSVISGNSQITKKIIDADKGILLTNGHMTLNAFGITNSDPTTLCSGDFTAIFKGDITKENQNTLPIEREEKNTEAESNDAVDKIRDSLLKDLETLITKITEYQDKFLKKLGITNAETEKELLEKQIADAIKNLSDKYEFIKYYENEYLPDFASCVQPFMKKVQEYSNALNNTTTEYNYKKDGICDTLEELAEKSDLTAYFEIKDAYKTLQLIEIEWHDAISRTKAPSDDSEKAPLQKLEEEHFHHEEIDPYENIRNLLPETCILLSQKINNYIKAKNSLNDINEELENIRKNNKEFEKNNEDISYYLTYIAELEGTSNENIDSEKQNNQIDTLDNYAKGLLNEYKALCEKCKANLQEIECLDNITANTEQIDSPNQIERRILNFLSLPMDSQFEDDFIISQTDFEDNCLHPRILPSVKLMGDEKNEVYLPTDTAPSRMFNYTMVHRLVEPKIKKNGRIIQRTKLDQALCIQDFKSKLCNDPESITMASSLGIGYSLNMHQAWVPDGFALGNLLYSLILAPGEEQRLIVREHKEDYTVSDDANAIDSIHDTYSNSQIDNETAAFTNAVGRYSSAHSDSSYYSKATSSGKSGIGFLFGIGASSSSTSTNSGSSSANSSQRDSYDEASHAAQNFQTSIKTESERIASANRTSIRVATSEESEAVSSRIIANHNHSHVMTVQYWEVSRRYRLETCIDGVELLLFVPLELIRFMPTKSNNIFSQYTLQLTAGTLEDYNKEAFEYRYSNILKYYDTIQKYVPRKYRSGLNLIKKYAALPYWDVEKISKTSQKYTVTITGGFCEFDNLSATIYFNNGSRPVKGILTQMGVNKLFIKDIDYDNNISRTKKPHTRKECIQAIINARDETQMGNKRSAVFSFTLPYGCSEDDISQISIKNSISNWQYTLSQDTDDMETWEAKAVDNYEHRLKDLYKDDTKSGYDQRKINHYAPGLPECYTNPIVTFTANELYSFGDLDITVKDTKELATGVLKSATFNVYRDNSYPRLRLSDIQKIEEAFHHIVSDTMYYSQVIWSSLSDDERIMLLEPYTIELDNIDKIASPESNAINTGNNYKSISLLNCVNAQKVVGFYGNCMMLPFTFPQELAETIGKTAGDIQDELYRYHACNFRVPSTVISVPTDGMVGEAVLGATNVSEKIDITRFWNWKDSDIDHIDLNQSSLNGRSLLENANTKDVNAPTVGVTPTEHINGNNLAAALIARQQPTFADVYQNTDMRDVMKNADNNASAGREQIIKANTELTKAALDAAVKAGSAALTGGMSEALGGGSSNPISGILGALGDAGLGNTELGKLLKDGVGENGSLSGIAKSIVGMINGDSSALTDALKSFGGEKLKNFLSNFASEAMDGKTLEESFKKSLASITGTDKNVTVNDILNMSKQFCSENGIQLDSFTSALANILGIL